jgi:hypothetical protein
MNEDDFKEEVRCFLAPHLRADSIIIGVLRYGAHLPHFYGSILRDDAVRMRVILSHMLEFFPRTLYSDNDFLILDDTVYHGKQMRANVDALIALGADPTRIKTAALVAHADSDFQPDFLARRLLEHDYIAWKEKFAAIVRQQMRPTDRDHPLYYFELTGATSTTLLSILEEFGVIRSATGALASMTSAFSLNLTAEVLQDFGEIPGIGLESLAKIRFYWRPDETGALSITAAPIVFPTLSIPEFADGGSAELSALSKVPESIFTDLLVNSPARSRMLFYFVSRTIASVLLRRVVGHLVERLREVGGRLEVKDSAKIDWPVEYIFPDAYTLFYSSVFEDLKELTSEQRVIAGRNLFSELWPIPTSEAPEVSAAQVRMTIPTIPRTFQILEFLARDHNPATYNGKRWVPNPNGAARTTFHQLVAHFKDVLFVSGALDDLLDVGLMRAEDGSINAGRTLFSRLLLSGGEYNAVQVSRVADTIRATPFEVPATILEEESLELWGSN